MCERCSILIIAYDRYHQSNIPFEYWDMDMTSFKGPKELVSIFNGYTADLFGLYQNGKSICLAGTNGIGKTFVSSCILKKCCQKNYNCLYTTLIDMVSALNDAPKSDKYIIQKEISMSDFVVIDELDSKYISTEASSDFFGRSLEHIFRTRAQNKLPTIFCTNSPNVVETFSGAIKQSMDSLMSKVKIFPIMGQDHRKVSQ